LASLTPTVNPILFFAVLLTSILTPVFSLPVIGEVDPVPSTVMIAPYCLSPVVDIELPMFNPTPFPIVPLTTASIPVFCVVASLTETR